MSGHRNIRLVGLDSKKAWIFEANACPGHSESLADGPKPGVSLNYSFTYRQTFVFGVLRLDILYGAGILMQDSRRTGLALFHPFEWRKSWARCMFAAA